MDNPYNDEIIIITAARPGFWLRKKLSPSRWVKSIFPSYADKLRVMDEVDKEIYQWVQEIEQLLKKIKGLKGNRSRKTVDAAVLLGAINKRLQKIVAAGQEVEQLHEEKVREFESNYEFDIDVEQYLSEESPFGLSDEEKEEFRGKYAGFIDDLKRRWLASRIETKESKKRQRAIQRLINLAEGTVDNLKTRLSNMEKAVASGRIGDYVDEIRTVSKIQSRFDDQFTRVYSQYLAPIVDPILEQYKEKPKETQKVDVESGEVVTTPEPKAETAQPEMEPEPGLDEPLPDYEGSSGEAEAVVDIDGTEYIADILEPVSEEPVEQQPRGLLPPVVPNIIPGTPAEPKIEYIGGGPELHEGETLQQYVRGPKEKIPQSLHEEMVHQKEIARQKKEHEEQQTRRLEKRKQQPKPEDPRLFQYVKKVQPELSVSPGGLSPSELKINPEQSQTEQALQAVTNKQFVNELKKVSNPYLQAAMISKYSEKFEDVDPEKSAKLLAVANKILANVEK